MENAEEVFQFLEEFSKRKPKIIPQELNDYLVYVARTGDPVYQWSLVKCLFKEKLVNVITDFHETTPSVEIPPCPNVDPFNYDIMKNSLIERLDSFTSAPFTVQRICELLTYPRKQYNRIDKFMRAIEKNILVVSTREPGPQRHQEPENGEPMEPMVNGSDNNSEYNVDVEMEDISWKETSEPRHESEPQPSSSDAHISVDDLEARLQAKQNETVGQDKQATEYESVTPPELNVVENIEEQLPEEKSTDIVKTTPEISVEKKTNPEVTENNSQKEKIDVEIIETVTTPPPTLIIPDIKVDDAEMTEQKLQEQAQATENIEQTTTTMKNTEENSATDEKSTDDSSSDASTKDESEPKNISEASSSSEESSSSSDNADGISNSPKCQNEVIPEKQDSNDENQNKDEENTPPAVINEVNVAIHSEDYSITDVNSELPKEPIETVNKTEITPENSQEERKLNIKEDEASDDVPTNTEIPSA